MRTLLLILGVSWAVLLQAEELLVIASPKVPDTAISTKQLVDIYSSKKIHWENDINVVPVNRESTSTERKKFSEAVFNLSPQALGEYWNRQKFQGKRPPVIQNSDQAVVNFVRSIPGSIGYISAKQSPAGVKVLLRLP